jgi:hypothetical protein
MHRLISNALNLQEELTSFVNQQMKLSDEKANQVPNIAWTAAEKPLPILNAFKYCM